MTTNRQSEADSRIQKCLSIDDNDNALNCLKREVQALAKEPGICRPRLVLFTQESCTPCSEERNLHKNEIDKGLIQEISLDTPYGLSVAEKNGIDFAPAVVLLDCNDNVIEFKE